jgi:hypothetical protein
MTYRASVVSALISAGCHHSYVFFNILTVIYCYSTNLEIQILIF